MPEPSPDPLTLDQAVDRGVEFLRRNQRDYGEFATFLGSDVELKKSPVVFDSSAFVTSLVVYCLSHVSHPAVDGMLSKATNFLVSEREGVGLWRYYSSRNFKHSRVPPDLDDTSCISFVLKGLGKTFPLNKEVILGNRNKEGLFGVWLKAHRGLILRNPGLYIELRKLQREAEAAQPPMPEEHRGNPRFRMKVDPVSPQDIDPVVSANVILYLGENESTAAAIRYLVGLIEHGRDLEANVYYPSPLALYYMMSRAHLHSAPGLGAAGVKIVDRLERLQLADGSLGVELLTGLAACTLATFAPMSQALCRAVSNIVDSQAQDGSWPQHSFYSGPDEFWGSPELTTAFCVEALSRYRRTQDVET
jgi:hypothetical protein